MTDLINGWSEAGTAHFSDGRPVLMGLPGSAGVAYAESHYCSYPVQ